MDLIYAISAFLFITFVAYICFVITFWWGLLVSHLISYGLAIAATGGAILFLLLSFPVFFGFLWQDVGFLELGKEVSKSLALAVLAFILWKIAFYIEKKYITQKKNRKLEDEQIKQAAMAAKIAVRKKEEAFQKGVIDGTVNKSRWVD